MTALWVLAGSVAYAVGVLVLAVCVGRLLTHRGKDNRQ